MSDNGEMQRLQIVTPGSEAIEEALERVAEVVQSFEKTVEALTRMVGNVNGQLLQAQRSMSDHANPVVHVEPPQVTVEMESPDVTVAAPNVHVPPAQVTVLPGQRETLTVERDERGFITRVIKEPT